ncbi:MAG: lipoyl(octanoyl) transferase LipB [Phycisphaerae bacterium]|nr:lipoyl(octanoyl) transferase LipB [Phycisphaerae bacterium]
MSVEIHDLGTMPYAAAYARQAEAVQRVLRDRDANAPGVGVVFFVQHPPVITLTPRAAPNLLASPAQLSCLGIEVAATDRGGDITYHGPGQLVVYPILDLNRLNLGLHAYMRLLEDTVRRTIARFGVEGGRDPAATGVWVGDAKICAMGVRVRQWVSMHGLALNVDPALEHFDLIVPCGLGGRGVTSLRRLLGPACPSMAAVQAALCEELGGAVGRARDAAVAIRAGGRGT